MLGSLPIMPPSGTLDYVALESLRHYPVSSSTELGGKHIDAVSFLGYIAHNSAEHGHILALTYGMARTTRACYLGEADSGHGIRP